MRVAIIGSRKLAAGEENCYKLLCENVPSNCTEIVSGGADGIDTLAQRYARENSILFKRFEPEYDKYGKNAPLVRNTEIVEYAHLVLAFWDGSSRGTAQVITLCGENNKPLEIFFV